MSDRDWTRGADGRSNTSATFVGAVAVVERMIRDGAHSLIGGNVETVARTIVANLAHVQGWTPPGVPGRVAEPTDIERAERELIDASVDAYAEATMETMRTDAVMPSARRAAAAARRLFDLRAPRKNGGAS